MTEQPPDWVLAIPSADVHNLPTQGTDWTRPFTQSQLLQIGQQFIEQFMQVVVKGILGQFIPGAGPAFDQLYTFFQGFFSAFDGIDLTNPGAVLAAIVNAIADAVEDIPVVGELAALIAKLVNGGQPINASNIFGSLLSSVFSGGVPIGALTASQPNLRREGDFTSPTAIAANDKWTRDADFGRTAAGSARVEADGTLLVLVSEPIAVSPSDDPIELQAFAHWADLVSTGSPIQFAIRKLAPGPIPNTYTLVGSETIDTIASPGTDSSDHADADEDGWVELSGNWTVEEGVSAYTTRLVVTETATAGVVHFDDDYEQQTGLIQQPWVLDLPEDLSALLEWVETIVDQLLGALGLDAVGSLLDKIFDLSDGFDDWFGDFDLLQGGFGDLGGRFEDLLGSVFGALQGGTPDLAIDDLIAAVQDALSSIPFLNILGIGGPGDIGGSVQETWNQWIGGLVGEVGSGAGLSDLFNIGQDISSRATLGLFSWDILGIRNNKSFSSGMLSSSTASIPLTQVAAGSSAPTFGVTSTTAITLYERVQESGECGVVRWMGSGVTNVTGFFLNIYQMDPVTGDRTCVYTSGDIKGDLSGTMTTNKHVLSDPIQREPGEIYGYELALTGTGTHTVVGQQSWIHDDPDVYPRRMSSVRSGGSVSVSTVQASGTIVYGSNIPFIETAVALDGVEIPHSPSTTTFSTPQSGTTLPIPSWCNTVEVVCLGGGGGGRQGGTWGVSGEGGDNGAYDTATWTRGTDFTGTPNITITVAAAATGGSGTGDNGGNCTAAITGHTVTGTGGEGGDALNAVGSDKNGQSPGNQTYGGVVYVGGGTQSSYGGNGAAPGGGGAGGNFVSFQGGGDGAVGAVWIRFVQ